MALAALVVCLLGAATALPPDAEKPLAIGFAQGFISDGPELMMCGQLAIGNAASVHTAFEDLTHGISHFNATEVEDALKEFANAFDGVPTTEKTCKTVVADIKSLVAALKVIKGPRDMVNRIVDHLFDDSIDIFGELSEADKAYKTGWDYMTAGQQLGTSVRHILIGEGDKPAPPPAPAGSRRELLAGVGIGFLSDSAEFLECGKALHDEGGEFVEALKDFEEGIRHLNSTAVKWAVEQWEAATKNAAGVKAGCMAASQEISKDVKAILAVVKQIKGPKDLVLKCVDNLFGDADMIFGELSEAGTVYKNADYMGSGRKLGMALRRMLVGEAVPKMASIIV